MSTNATSADPGGSLSVSADILSEAFLPTEHAAVRRLAQLRRQLLSADIIAGTFTGALVALVSGLAAAKLPVVALAVGLGWPVLAYVCGLYALDDLRSWATGVGDAPRLAVTALLISWPLFGLLTALDADHAVVGALCAAVVTGAGAGISRTVARVGLHRSPRLRERTLILGSGAVAEQLVQRLERHDQLGLEPVGYIDDDVHEPGRLAIPRLGTLDSLPELIALGRVDRVMIAFSRASHEDLLHSIRVCRDAGVTVDIVPRLFEFLEGARTIEQIGGIPRMTISQPTFTPLSRFSKRMLDIVGSLVAMIVLAPLLAVIAVAIRLDSPGPVF
ncbi:MAG TPA: hypothetical protein VFG79_02695, partial [Solirubrobacter sp.]|nr:hypothetical protein [Solirubrobacter sp.]